MNKIYAILLLMGLVSLCAHGDINNWQTGETIPGTEAITPAPNTDLSNWNSSGHNLNFADLQDFVLNNSTFENSWLRNARFFDADLTNVNFKYADLSDARIGDATLVGADFTDSIIGGASFYGSTWIVQDGFTKEQFYSTKSYKDSNTQNIDFSMCKLQEWDFSNVDLTSSRFYLSNLSNANFSNAIIRGANFEHLTGNSMTTSLIYATKSYQDGDLQNINFSDNWFEDWNFTNQNLTDSSFYAGGVSRADFSNANLSSVNFSECYVVDAIFDNATITGASFSTNNEDYLDFGFTKEQLYSTKSYKDGNLQGMSIGVDLRNWDFSGQDLTNSTLGRVVHGANFSDAVIKGFAFYTSENSGFTKEMLYSTKSYVDKNLEGIKLISYNTVGIDLRNINLSNQNLQNSEFERCKFQNAFFQNANLTNAIFTESNFENANFSGAKLKGAVLSSQDFTNSKFIKSDLSYANLYNADLGGCDFTGANLARSLFYTDSSDLQNADFSLADLRLSKNFTPHSSTILSNSINRSGYVYDLNLNSDDKLTVRTLIDSNGYRTAPIKFSGSMEMAEDSAIHLVLRDFKERSWNPLYLMYIEDGIIPDLSGVLEFSLDEGQYISDLMGRTFHVIQWGDVPLESRYFSDLITTPNLYCDFTDFYTDGTVTIIPEPTTLSLLALGAFLAGRRRK